MLPSTLQCTGQLRTKKRPSGETPGLDCRDRNLCREARAVWVPVSLRRSAAGMALSQATQRSPPHDNQKHLPQIPEGPGEHCRSFAFRGVLVLSARLRSIFMSSLHAVAGGRCFRVPVRDRKGLLKRLHPLSAARKQRRPG